MERGRVARALKPDPVGGAQAVGLWDLGPMARLITKGYPEGAYHRVPLVDASGRPSPWHLALCASFGCPAPQWCKVDQMPDEAILREKARAAVRTESSLPVALIERGAGLASAPSVRSAAFRSTPIRWSSRSSSRVTVTTPGSTSSTSTSGASRRGSSSAAR
jgi:hypothetical protein